MTTTRGRPRAISRAMLQEAAFELFLTDGYAGTTVDQIANCAGVSRSTFFNYFDGKSDVFWVELDGSLELLRDALRDADDQMPAMSAVHQGLVAVGREFGPGQVPWAITQRDLIGGIEELQSSAVVRVTRLVELLRDEIERRLPASAPRVLASAAASAAIGAAVAALVTWAEAGTSRGALSPTLERALSPVCDGFQRTIDSLSVPGAPRTPML